MARLVGVRFRQAGKVFYFDAGDLEVQTGSYVVVESAHGVSIARVVITPEQVISAEGLVEEEIKPVLRLATEEDLELNERMKQQAEDALRAAKRLAAQHDLDMSIASGEFDLSGNQFTAYFSAAERVDFRGLVRDLSRELGARVQFLQVGDRDRAKLVDGVDICGERLCCASWMSSFPSVSIRMAKEQDLPLNPQKISGVCGRLYCCLTFEYEDYRALRGTLPKVGSFLSTPAGEARVMGIDFNREVVRLMLTESRTPFEVAAIDFKLQNGVTVRPMELVRKIEGPLRTIAEDGEAERARGRGRERRPQRPPATTAPAGPAATGATPGRPPRASAQPARPRPERAEPAPAPTSDAARKRRRRRRRGRGGSGDGDGPPFG